VELTVGALDGKVAVITGATAGTGLGIATRFAAEGAHVCLLARDPERLEKLAADVGGDALAIPTDVGDPASVAAAFGVIGDRFGKVDVLINNAAVYKPCRVEKLSDAEIRQTFDTNLLGPIYTARAAIPLLRAAGGGDIINTSSESTLHPFPMLSVYVASKAGLEIFGQVLADELLDDGIRVTTLVQGTAVGAGGGSVGWEWDPDHLTEAITLWTERGLMQGSQGRLGGQEVDAVADVHVYIVTRPRNQKLDKIHVRSF
jgi:NAD(P)-dependent dehydrogenase (short-subunit alcohol dehydrogenase family)